MVAEEMNATSSFFSQWTIGVDLFSLLNAQSGHCHPWRRGMVKKKKYLCDVSYFRDKIVT